MNQSQSPPPDLPKQRSSPYSKYDPSLPLPSIHLGIPIFNTSSITQTYLSTETNLWVTSFANQFVQGDVASDADELAYDQFTAMPSNVLRAFTINSKPITHKTHHHEFVSDVYANSSFESTPLHNRLEMNLNSTTGHTRSSDKVPGDLQFMIVPSSQIKTPQRFEIDPETQLPTATASPQYFRALHPSGLFEQLLVPTGNSETYNGTEYSLVRAIYPLNLTNQALPYPISPITNRPNATLQSQDFLQSYMNKLELVIPPSIPSHQFPQLLNNTFLNIHPMYHTFIPPDNLFTYKSHHFPQIRSFESIFHKKMPSSYLTSFMPVSTATFLNSEDHIPFTIPFCVFYLDPTSFQSSYGFIVGLMHILQWRNQGSVYFPRPTISGQDPLKHTLGPNHPQTSNIFSHESHVPFDILVILQNADKLDQQQFINVNELAALDLNLSFHFHAQNITSEFPEPELQQNTDLESTMQSLHSTTTTTTTTKQSPVSILTNTTSLLSTPPSRIPREFYNTALRLSNFLNSQILRTYLHLAELFQPPTTIKSNALSALSPMQLYTMYRTSDPKDLVASVFPLDVFDSPDDRSSINLHEINHHGHLLSIHPQHTSLSPLYPHYFALCAHFLTLQNIQHHLQFSDERQAMERMVVENDIQLHHLTMPVITIGEPFPDFSLRFPSFTQLHPHQEIHEHLLIEAVTDPRDPAPVPDGKRVVSKILPYHEGVGVFKDTIITATAVSQRHLKRLDDAKESSAKSDQDQSTAGGGGGGGGGDGDNDDTVLPYQPVYKADHWNECRVQDRYRTFATRYSTSLTPHITYNCHSIPVWTQSFRPQGQEGIKHAIAETSVVQPNYPYPYPTIQPVYTQFQFDTIFNTNSSKETTQPHPSTQKRINHHIYLRFQHSSDRFPTTTNPSNSTVSCAVFNHTPHSIPGIIAIHHGFATDVDRQERPAGFNMSSQDIRVRCLLTKDPLNTQLSNFDPFRFQNVPLFLIFIIPTDVDRSEFPSDFNDGKTTLSRLTRHSPAFRNKNKFLSKSNSYKEYFMAYQQDHVLSPSQHAHNNRQEALLDQLSAIIQTANLPSVPKKLPQLIHNYIGSIQSKLNKVMQDFHLYIQSEFIPFCEQHQASLDADDLLIMSSIQDSQDHDAWEGMLAVTARHYQAIGVKNDAHITKCTKFRREIGLYQSQITAARSFLGLCSLLHCRDTEHSSEDQFALNRRDMKTATAVVDKIHSHLTTLQINHVNLPFSRAFAPVAPQCPYTLYQYVITVDQLDDTLKKVREIALVDYFSKYRLTWGFK